MEKKVETEWAKEGTTQRPALLHKAMLALIDTESINLVRPHEKGSRRRNRKIGRNKAINRFLIRRWLPQNVTRKEKRMRKPSGGSIRGEGVVQIIERKLLNCSWSQIA